MPILVTIKETGLARVGEPVTPSLAAIMLVNGSVAGFQSMIYNDRGASGALSIQGVVLFRGGHDSVGIGDLVGLGGRL